MIYRLLADLVVSLHFLFVVFVVAGGLLVLRWPWMGWVHLPTAVWGAAIELGGWICPLTPLENAFRRAGGAAGYEGGFIEHYILPVLYPSALTRPIQLVLAGVVVLTNVAIYVGILRRRGARQSSAAS